jgi:hypothetical protein
VPAVAAQAILGSLGGALAVAREVGGPLGAGLVTVARSSFMTGTQAALIAGLAVTGAGALLVLALLPSRSAAKR